MIYQSELQYYKNFIIDYLVLHPNDDSDVIYNSLSSFLKHDLKGDCELYHALLDYLDEVVGLSEREERFLNEEINDIFHLRHP